MFHVAFAADPLIDYRSAAWMDTPRYHQLTRALMERGIRVLERGLWCVPTVDPEEEIEETLAAVRWVLERENVGM